MEVLIDGWCEMFPLKDVGFYGLMYCVAVAGAVVFKLTLRNPNDDKDD